jgi:hypothetical protein
MVKFLPQIATLEFWRHWQEFALMIILITTRPVSSMQEQADEDGSDHQGHQHQLPGRQEAFTKFAPIPHHSLRHGPPAAGNWFHQAHYLFQ